MEETPAQLFTALICAQDPTLPLTAVTNTEPRGGALTAEIARMDLIAQPQQVSTRCLVCQRDTETSVPFERSNGGTFSDVHSLHGTGDRLCPDCYMAIRHSKGNNRRWSVWACRLADGSIYGQYPWDGSFPWWQMPASRPLLAANPGDRFHRSPYLHRAQMSHDPKWLCLWDGDSESPGIYLQASVQARVRDLFADLNKIPEGKTGRTRWVEQWLKPVLNNVPSLSKWDARLLLARSQEQLALILAKQNQAACESA